MFKFIKSRFGKTVPVVETQRQTIDRALSEVNVIVALLDPKPMITINPQTGSLALELPEQMPDEALALPAPKDHDQPNGIKRLNER
jgi:hypothetical protein